MAHGHASCSSWAGCGKRVTSKAPEVQGAVTLGGGVGNGVQHQRQGGKPGCEIWMDGLDAQITAFLPPPALLLSLLLVIPTTPLLLQSLSHSSHTLHPISSHPHPANADVNADVAVSLVCLDLCCGYVPRPCPASRHNPAHPCAHAPLLHQAIILFLPSDRSTL
jgi:hypothetical protein